jgi:hypothetical protein
VTEIVDRILKAYGHELDVAAREKIIRYLETLTSAGKRDFRQLTVYGLAYLKQLKNGPDTRYTGC